MTVFLIARIISFIPRLILGAVAIYAANLLLFPVLTHFAVFKNTITHFLLSTGMIGPLTIQFLYFFLSAFIFFILYRSIERSI